MQLWLHLHQPCPRLRCTPSRQCPAAVPGRSLWFWCDWATSPGHYGLPGPCGPTSSLPDTSFPGKERQNQRRGAAGGWLWIHGAVNHFHSMIAAVCSHQCGRCQCEQRIIVITVIIINRCFDRVLHHVVPHVSDCGRRASEGALIAFQAYSSQNLQWEKLTRVASWTTSCWRKLLAILCQRTFQRPIALTHGRHAVESTGKVMTAVKFI